MRSYIKMVALKLTRVRSCRSLSSQANKTMNNCFEKSTKKTANANGRIVTVEGNIGVGKTTLTYQLGRKLNYRVFLEPASENPYLSKFYEEPKKYALEMQLWLFRQRCRTYMKAIGHLMKSGEGVILDRSLFSDHVFAVVTHSDGFISDEGYEHYCNISKQVLNLVPPPHIVVYLDAIPKKCQERIFKRGRNCESGISLEYLSSLNSAYKDFLKEISETSEVTSYDWSEYGHSYEVDKYIRNASVSDMNLNEETYQSINKRVNDILNTGSDNVNESNDIEVNDNELNNEEINHVLKKGDS